MPWNANVVTSFDFNAVEPQVRSKINEVAADAGRGSHGAVTFNNGTVAPGHWRCGSYRFFGSYVGGILNVVGIGMHTGKGDSNYKVELGAGGKTKATTS